MTTAPGVPPANFNLAVETLKRTLRQDKVAEVALSQAQEPQKQIRLNVNVSASGSDLSLGSNISTDA
jgi:hypothetical protein